MIARTAAIDDVVTDRRRVAALRRYRWLCLGLACVGLVFAACLSSRFGGADVERLVSDFGLCAAAFAAAIACGARTRQAVSRMKWSWALIAAGSLSWGLGQAVWTWYDCVEHVQVPFPSFADVGYLGMPLCTAAGLLAVPLAAQAVANRARSVLDGLMVAAGLLLISFMLLVGRLISAGADSTLGLVISLAYPVSDVVIVTIVLFILARDRQSHSARMPLFLIGAGLVIFSLSDSGFAYLTITGAYTSGATIDAGWFAGFLLIVLAGLKPAPTVEVGATENRVGGPIGIMLPYLVVVGAVLASVIDTLQGRHTSTFVFWDRSLMILLMIGRQALTMLENRALTRNLEARVEARTAELRSSEQRFQALVQHSSDVVTVIDLDTVVLYQSQSMERVFGHDPVVLLGRPLTSLLASRDAGRLNEGINSVVSRPYGTVTIEVALSHARGHDCQAEITITNLLADPNVGALVLNSRDITERKTLESQLIHEAFHDALTNLANRALFTDRVEQELRRRDRNAAPVSVLFLDLDGFKEINDSRGHAVGDNVLVEVAHRLSASVRAEDTVARFGGDEFAILVTGSEDETDRAEEVAQRVLDALRVPIGVDQVDLHVTASIGIAYGGWEASDASDAGRLMRNADLAMYRTKAAGAHGYTLYHPEMHSDLVGRLELAAEMRRGLNNDEFSVFFQPNIEMTSGRILGFEALARWQHPVRGFVPPSEFIPVAESTGMICQLGTWILTESCLQAQAWTAAEGRPIGVSVNVSARQLDQPDFIDLVRQALSRSGLAPELLCLEMTESVLLDDSDAVLATLNALKEVGVRLAIDDFGTGYSSLSYLNRFPFDILKIDKSFIDRLGNAGGEATLTRSIVQLGHSLGVRTVAEGLEHFDQFLALRRMGCDVGQGYYFSRPLPADHASELLSADAATAWTSTLPTVADSDGLIA